MEREIVVNLEEEQSINGIVSSEEPINAHFDFAKGEDGVSITEITTGEASQSGGYTVTDITFNKSDGSSVVLSVSAKNGVDGTVSFDELTDDQKAQIKGETGETGKTGETGETGATFTPIVSETGDLSWTNDKGLENPPTVNIKGKKGDTGATGAPNILTIGTVVGGDNANATITGSSPNQILNLVLPKGDKGDQGEKGDTPIKGTDYFTPSDIANLNIPNLTSQLTNDSGFTTKAYVDMSIQNAIDSVWESDL